MSLSLIATIASCKTSLTEFKQQMRARDLLAYLSLHCFSNGQMFLVLFCSNLVQKSISQKFNLCVTDGPTDGRTDSPSYRDARTHLKSVMVPVKRKTSAFCFLASWRHVICWAATERTGKSMRLNSSKQPQDPD